MQRYLLHLFLVGGRMILNRFGNKIVYENAVSLAPLLCHRCQNSNRRLFYTYYSEHFNENVTYCLNCVHLGAMTNQTPLKAIDIESTMDRCHYALKFELSEAQRRASDAIVDATASCKNVLLNAVTGSGKTEITFASIKVARQAGKRVAFIAPRIDVVKEVYMRLREAFSATRIDLKYDGVKIEFEHQFLVATVQQLYNYKTHFDLIIVDETDAFPLTTDDELMRAITHAATDVHSIIFMTATPSKRMMRFLGEHETIAIAKRYHGHPLAIPDTYWMNIIKDIRKGKPNNYLFDLLDLIIQKERKVLVFVPEIELMHMLEVILNQHFENITSVYSGDDARYTKVEAMRESHIKILLTTTILERGVTFPFLDVIVIGADYYDFSSLMQICGRVGRKIEDPHGHIYFFSEFNTLGIKKTIRTIKELNGVEI